MKKPEYEDAIYHYKKIISIDKNNAKAHYNLALILKIQKKYKDAQNHFEKAIDIINDYSKAHFHLAMLLKEKGLVISKDNGKYSLSDACNVLINNQDLGGVNIDDSLWLDIDTPEALVYINKNRKLFE